MFFGLSYKWLVSLFLIFVLTITHTLTTTLPDVFLPRIVLPYQAWIIAVWLFIFLLPKSVTPF